MNIELLGVNQNNQAAYNSVATSGRTLPWLQDTLENSAWALWGVTYRDVRILDAQNRLHAVYNLTTHDLASADNRAALKALLLDAARFVDSDNDDLSDDWEFLNFGNLAVTGDGDFDADGHDNFSEYAFGTNPTNGASTVTFQTTLQGTGASRALEVRFHRRAGSALDYRLDTASVISPWISSSPEPEMVEPFRNLFDGSGTGWTTCRVPAQAEGNQFLRIRAIPATQPCCP